MSAISLTEDQTKLLRLCLKHAEPLKVMKLAGGCIVEQSLANLLPLTITYADQVQPNWEKVMVEGNMVSTSAA